MSTPDLLKLRIGISACLLGQEVRYNGGHKRDAFLTDTFGRYVEWVAVCPEVELGMGTPRPPIRLERRGEETRLVMPSTGAFDSPAAACKSSRSFCGTMPFSSPVMSRASARVRA